MAGILFDTHAFIRQLRESGFEEEQAEALSEAMKNVREAITQEAVTKSDINEVRHEIRELELKMGNQLESIRGEITLLKWMMGVLLAGVASLVLRSFFLS